MKKLLLLPLILLFALNLKGQKMDFWLDAGLKVQYGGSMLFNGAINDDPNFDYSITTSTKFGGKIGINWNYTGVSFEVMTGKHKGLFQDTGGNNVGDTEVSVQSTDVYVLFRDARKKGYFELGPKVSFIGDVTTKVGNGQSSPAINPDFYEKNPLAAVIGFGTYILGNDGAFSGILGLRFEYGFTDIVSEAGRTSETMRQPVSYTGDASSTNPIFAGIVFELNWGIGGVGQARCGEKSKFIWF